MSYAKIKDLSKADLKVKLSKMGMSFNHTDYPRDYYAKLYLDKSNAKSKITRNNIPFYREEQIINRKRERSRNDRMDDKIYARNISEKEKEEEEEIEYNSDEEDYINENEQKRGNNSSIRKNQRYRDIVKEDEDNKEKKGSGVKTTRLIAYRQKRKAEKSNNNSTERKGRSQEKLIPKSYRKLRNSQKRTSNNNLNRDEYYYYPEKSQRKMDISNEKRNRTRISARKMNRNQSQNKGKRNYEQNSEVKTAEKRTSRKRAREYFKSKSKSKSNEKRLRFPRNKNDDKNIIKVGAQNDNNYNKSSYNLRSDKNNDSNLKNINNQKDVYLNVANSKKNNHLFIIKSANKSEQSEEKKNKMKKSTKGREINLKNSNELNQPKFVESNEEELIRESNNPDKTHNNESMENTPNDLRYGGNSNGNIKYDDKNGNNFTRNNANEVNDNMIIEDNNNQKNQLNQMNSDYDNVDTENMSVATSRFSLGRFGSNLNNVKNTIMNKFSKKIFLLPLVILIMFGIVYYWQIDIYNVWNIGILFSIMMALIIFYNLFAYVKDLRKYKKMAREDKKKLIEFLQSHNIRQEELANNVILLNEYFDNLVSSHQIPFEEYIKYVFPYLSKYLKKDGFILYKEDDNDGNNHNYWKKF